MTKSCIVLQSGASHDTISLGHSRGFCKAKQLYEKHFTVFAIYRSGVRIPHSPTGEKSRRTGGFFHPQSNWDRTEDPDPSDSEQRRMIRREESEAARKAEAGCRGLKGESPILHKELAVH